MQKSIRVEAGWTVDEVPNLELELAAEKLTLCLLDP